MLGPDDPNVASDGYLLKSREKRAGGPDGIHSTEHLTYNLCSGVERQAPREETQASGS